MDEASDNLNYNDNPYVESPIWMRVPRRLNFSPVNSDDDSPPPSTDICQSPIRNSPPYRPLRTLRLGENPLTPGSIFVNSHAKPNLHQTVLTGRLSAPNLNPFTPECIARNRKRCRSDRQSMNDSMDYNGDDTNALNNNVVKIKVLDESESEERPAKRLNLIESNTGLSRYLNEFQEKRLLGTGEFGCVYLCTHRMDGCDYAIKKSNKPILARSANERRALNEVFAHAVLGNHENVVRYFSAWSENKHMLIQNEYCNLGSLQDAVDIHRKNGTCFSESEIRRILKHLAEGLRYIHANDLVHMDIKPGNIFMHRENRSRQPLNDDGYEEDEGTVVYKFGDFGHVTSVDPTPRSVEEGDARYLAMEVFHDDYSNLTKADIFALGLTVFEAAGGGPLHKNGPEWHDLRSGKVPFLNQIGKDLNDLIKQMTDPNPANRPTALEILKHSAVMPPANKTKEQLERELQSTKTKFQILEKKLKAFTSLCKSEMIARDLSSGVRTRSNARMVGRTTHRSQSATEFGW